MEFGESMGLEGAELMEWVRTQQIVEKEDKEYEKEETEREDKRQERQRLFEIDQEAK